MRHHNSVFHQVLKHVPWGVFDRLVDQHRADYRTRSLTSKGQFLALLFGQLAGASSLREIEAGLISQRARLYHAGGCCVARSTLADANARRPAALYGDLFAHMAAAAEMIVDSAAPAGIWRILDATRVQVSSLSGGWVAAVKGARAVKLHVVYDPRAEAPCRLDVTGQTVNDITPAKAMPIEPGMTYVFDLAYYDYGWWARLDAAGCRFVTRLKTNTRLTVSAERTVCDQGAGQGADQGSVIADRIGLLPQRMSRSRRNPCADPVREITVRLSTGKTIRLVTNDLDAPAEEIADLYKQRWQIELFFKWIKQNLKIRHVLGTSENAVRIQVYVALIAYMLLRAAKATQKAIEQPTTFLRLVRLNLMHRRPINALKSHQPPTVADNRQMTLFDT